MSDLRFDLDSLGLASRRIRRVSDQLDGSGDDSRHLPGAAGHERVHDALSDFQDKWSVHREEIQEELAFLSDALTAIVDTFTQLDSDLSARAEHFLEVANTDGTN